MLKVDIQFASPAVTLACSGRLVLGVEVEALRCMATSRHERHLVLDLSRVRMIDAAGLGLLVELHRWARRRSATLIIANPSPRAHRLITLVCLDQVLNLSLPVGTVERDGSEEWNCMTA